MTLAGLNDPFLTHKLDHTLTLPPGHIPELHEPALKKAKEVLGQCRLSGQGLGIFVQGEAGCGKSHLIAQLRDQFVKDPNAVLISVRMGGAFAGRLWRHVRQALVGDLLWRYPTKQAEPNGLARILCRRFPDWAKARRGGTGGLLDAVLGFTPNKDLLAYLKQYSDASTYPMDYKLQQVLVKLATEKDTSLAQSWLARGQLGDKDLKTLDLPLSNPTDHEQETESRDVVLSLLRLAGDKTTLFICFDQIEAIQTGTYDSAVLRQFATVLTDLLAEEGPRVVATCIRPNLLDQMTKAADVSDISKIGQEKTHVLVLSLDQAVSLAVARLDAESSCQPLRRQNAHDPTYPLGKQFLETLHQNNKRSLTPRHLIMACSAEFRRLQTGSVPVQPPQPGTPPPPPADPPPGDVLLGTDLADGFMRTWMARRKKHMQSLQGISFDTVMALGLPWLVHLTQTPLDEVKDQDKRLGDINLRFQPTALGLKAAGVSVCNHEPRTLWRRLDRVLKQWNTAKQDKLLSRLVIVRSAAERTTKESDSRMKELTQAGAHVILVERQALAEMAAFQALLTMSLKGDITWGGKIIDAAKYDEWAKDNLSDAVKEFFHEVFEPFLPTKARAKPPAPPGPQQQAAKSTPVTK